MNQSELIEKVAQATELNQATAGQAVKAVVNAVLDALLMWRRGPHARGGIHKPERPSRSQPAR